MLNPDWDIKPRGMACAQCQKPFNDNQEFVSALVFDNDGYQRQDHCHACWAAHPVSDKALVSQWKGVFRAPAPPAPEPLNRENVERMLRNLMSSGEPDRLNVIYILAVILERRRILVERDVQKRSDNALIRVYEHRRTGETFLIADPMLDLDLLEHVRREVNDLLIGPPITPAATPPYRPPKKTLTMQTIYARFNRQRLPQFQVATFIRQDDAQRMVIKQALTDAARGHLQSMRQAHHLMERRRAVSNIILPAVLENASTADSLALEYIDAPSLDQILHQALCDNDTAGFWNALDDYRQLLGEAFGAVERASITGALREIFGRDIAGRLGDRAPCTGIALLDPVFENVLIRGADRVFIDNEWVREGALPGNFAVFRSLYYFFKIKYAPFDIEKTVKYADALQHCGISAADAALYRAMDEAFQAHVFGADRHHAIPERYAKYAHTSIASMEQTIEHQRQVVRGLHGEITAMRNTLGWRALEKLRRVWPGTRQ